MLRNKKDDTGGMMKPKEFKDVKYISTILAGKLLGVSVFSVQRWFDDGLFKGPKTPGGRRLILIDSFLEFARKQHYEFDRKDIEKAWTESRNSRMAKYAEMRLKNRMRKRKVK